MGNIIFGRFYNAYDVKKTFEGRKSGLQKILKHSTSSLSNFKVQLFEKGNLA